MNPITLFNYLVNQYGDSVSSWHTTKKSLIIHLNDGSKRTIPLDSIR